MGLVLVLLDEFCVVLDVIVFGDCSAFVLVVGVLCCVVLELLRDKFVAEYGCGRGEFVFVCT